MYKRLALLIPALVLSACIVVIGDEDADIHYDDDRAVKQHEHSSKNDSYELSNRIEDAILADPQLLNADISVSSEGHNIFLHGELFSTDDLDRAVDIALLDPEVESVSSRIILNLVK